MYKVMIAKAVVITYQSSMQLKMGGQGTAGQESNTSTL